MPEWITKYWIEWIFGVGIAILTWLYKTLSAQLARERAEAQALRDGMRSLLKRQIEMDCEAAIKEGWCSVNRKNVISDMYSSYHALGGNSGTTQIYDQMMGLSSVAPQD